MSNRQTLAGIYEQVYRRFPEIAGTQPRVQDQPGNKLLLIFHSSAKTSDGKNMPRTVRVVVDASGKIIKTTSSR
jgi:hypothetical protein